MGILHENLSTFYCYRLKKFAIKTLNIVILLKVRWLNNAINNSLPWLSQLRERVTVLCCTYIAYHVDYKWKLLNVPGITLSLRNTKQYNYLSCSSFKRVPLCSYTLLPVTVKTLKYSWKHFIKAFSALPSHS